MNDGMSKTTIGLCMIVKDEAHVIGRALDRLLPLVDAAVIVDTGSTDDTRGVVWGKLSSRFTVTVLNKPLTSPHSGAMYDQPWVDFSTNRNQALDLFRHPAHNQVDYILIMDADDLLVVSSPENFRNEIELLKVDDEITEGDDRRCDVLHVSMNCGPVLYSRPLIIRNIPEIRYKGVIHEYLDIPFFIGSRMVRHANLLCAKIDCVGDGARSKDGNKFIRDVVILEEAIMSEKDEKLKARYHFYAGQSYRDLAQSYQGPTRESMELKAIHHYLNRVSYSKMDWSWREEVYVSYTEAGKLMTRLALEGSYSCPVNVDDTKNAFLRAQRTIPDRWEAFYHMGQLYMHLGKPDKALEMFTRPEHSGGFKKKLESDLPLFHEAWIYDTAMKDMRSVALFQVGRFRESLDLCMELLDRGLSPPDRERVVRNAVYALNALYITLPKEA